MNEFNIIKKRIMNNELRTIILDLLEKKFSYAINGYDAAEVDLFLDSIIKRINTVEEESVGIEKSKAEVITKISLLEKEKSVLEIENQKLHSELEKLSGDTKVTVDNRDLLKKIDALEKFLFKNGFDPSKIV